MKKIVDLFVL